MLLIFGFNVRFKTVSSALFFCPVCGGDRDGALRVARRWFTLFWLPVIPLRTVGEVVECATCGTRFDPEVAHAPTTGEIARVLDDAIRALTAMIVATGDRSDPNLRAAAISAITAVERAYGEPALEADLAALDPAIADRYGAPLADALDVSGKERLVGDLVRVALAGDLFTSDQRRVIDLAGRGLGLTPAHVTGIVASVASGPNRVDPPTPPAADSPPA